MSDFEKDLVTVPRVMAACLTGSVLAVLLLRDITPVFKYDATVYWVASQTIVDGFDPYALGGLQVRGVLTALVYLPAGWVAHLFGDTATAASWAVLVENAVIVGLAGSVVVPLLVRRLTPVGPAHVLVSSVLTVLLLSGFAPYPLVDLAAVFLVLLGLLMLSSASWWSLVLGGALLAGATNLRPAYLVPAVLVLVVFAVGNWRRAPLPAVGAVGILGVQSWYGWTHAGTLAPWPPATSTVTDIQLNYAAYGVRYDTVAYSISADPRQWYCNPEMARAVAGDLPTSSGDLLRTFVETLPTSALFAAEKLGATLQWSWATPYATSFTQTLRPLGILVVAITCAGLMWLVRIVAASRNREFLALASLALAVGSMVTLVGSSPEARFAAPIVVIALVGCLAGMAELRRWSGSLKSRVGWITSFLLVTAATLAIGVAGMSNPAPDGDVTAELCSQT